jgi:hypothetical protein
METIYSKYDPPALFEGSKLTYISDIVDTRRCDDNIREIVIGSISKYHDGKKFKDG